MKEIYLNRSLMNQFINGELAICGDLRQAEAIVEYCKTIDDINICVEYNDRNVDKCIIYKKKDSNSFVFQYYSKSLPLNRDNHEMTPCSFVSLVENSMDNNPIVLKRVRSLSITKDSIESGLRSIISEYLKLKNHVPESSSRALVDNFTICTYTHILSKFGIDTDDIIEDVAIVEIEE